MKVSQSAKARVDFDSNVFAQWDNVSSKVSSEAIIQQMLKSISSSQASKTPYPNWNLTNCLPEEVVNAISALPFPVPDLAGVSGKRELHNATRNYFDQPNMLRYPVCLAFNEAFQDPRLTGRFEDFFGTNLKGSYLRVEYAQDTGGFWLEPHTDLGVKVFTMLLYLSKDPRHTNLGTDIYDINKKHVGRSPFAPNSAFVFIPSDISYHGFEPRNIEGIRQSLIINYVTKEWRAREQLAYPDRSI
ncbi:MAG: 2OG-Fe(II) oxygenase [Hyphomicrobium sp.]